jgi:hypothetical protein
MRVYIINIEIDNFLTMIFFVIIVFETFFFPYRNISIQYRVIKLIDVDFEFLEKDFRNGEIKNRYTKGSSFSKMFLKAKGALAGAFDLKKLLMTQLIAMYVRTIFMILGLWGCCCWPAAPPAAGAPAGPGLAGFI